MKRNVGAAHLAAESTQRDATMEDSPRKPAPSRELLISAAIAGGLVLIAVTIGVLLSSCGGTDRSSGDQVAAQPVQSRAVEPADAKPAPPPTHAEPSGVTKPAQGPIPDVTASVADTMAAPGDSVEIIARGTPDVTEVTVWDGIHDKQALAYDAAAKLWRGAYRMPLSPKRERVGLSVTAKNGANRWRRVWIFLRVEPEESGCDVDPDSTAS